MYKELLMGCGSNDSKRIYIRDEKKWKNLTRLDNNPAHSPDVLHDLREHPLPFEDNTFDEVHAYEVLEHLAQQGDYEFFFREFTEYHRILKPGGFFCASVPAWNSEWAWGDPSHTRVITPNSFIFLDQEEYENQVGVTAMSDFRHIYKVSFKVVYCETINETLIFALHAQGE